MDDHRETEQIRIDTDTVEAREVDGELVILDLKSRNYIGGNPSVAVLWPLLTAGTTAPAMADRLVAEYSIDRSEAMRDTEALIETLKDLDLLRG